MFARWLNFFGRDFLKLGLPMLVGLFFWRALDDGFPSAFSSLPGTVLGIVLVIGLKSIWTTYAAFVKTGIR